MQMLVRVDMIEIEARRAERLELGADLGGKPAPDAGHEEITQSRAELAVGKTAVVADQPIDCGGGQHCLAIDQHEVQSDAQPRQRPRPRHRIGRRRGCHHQTGAGQNAVAVRLLDRLVDRYVASEIVGADDQPPASLRHRCVNRPQRAAP